MSSWRIREIEHEIEDLERKLRHSSINEENDIRRKIENLKSELRRLKRREEEEDDEDNEDNGLLSSMIGIGMGMGSHSSGGGFSFGGGSSGGGGFGGGW